MLVITTAGFNLGGPCYAMRDRSRKVLGGIMADDELFAIIYTVDKDDDWTSAASLIKANPNYGVSVMEDFLLAQQSKAMQSQSKQNAFKTKHLNVWCNASSAWMNMLKWDACADTSLSLEDFAGRRAFAALDLASKIDMAAKVLLFPREIGGEMHYYVFGTYYLPEETVQESGNEQYRGWAHEERLTLTPGNVIDFGYIEEDLKQDASRFELVEVPYDPFQATQLSTRMVEQGFPMVEMRPTVLGFSEPMKELESLVLSGRLHHNGCPIMTWMVSNVVAHLDAKDNIYPRKERPENKIDGVVALIMALGRALVKTDGGKSFWES
jgi:phage terminase large subunit-like protein